MRDQPVRYNMLELRVPIINIRRIYRNAKNTRRTFITCFLESLTRITKTARFDVDITHFFSTGHVVSGSLNLVRFNKLT